MKALFVYFQKNQFLSRGLFALGVLGVGFIGYGTFFDASSDVETLLLSSGFSQDEIDQSLMPNTLKRSSSRFLDFPKKVRISDGAYQVAENSRGVSVSAGGESYFYPFDTISPYNVVNDTIAGQPILVAYCSNCETAIIADRVVGGQEYFFEATDDLWEGSLIMVTRGGDARLWQQASGEELVSDDRRNLDFLPFDITSFAQYRVNYPTGKLVIKP